MKRNDSDTSVVPSAADYKNGIHYQWECAAHTAGDNFLRAHKRAWTYEERKEWIHAYMIKTDVATQLSIVPCEVCQEAIGEALLAGEDPYACPDVLKTQLRKAGIGFKLGRTHPPRESYKSL